MIRLIIYIIAIINICIGLYFLYRRPAPFGKSGFIRYTYEDYPDGRRGYDSGHRESQERGYKKKE